MKYILINSILFFSILIFHQNSFGQFQNQTLTLKALLQSGQNARAQDYYNQNQDFFTGTPEKWLLAGEVFYTQGDFNRSLKYFEKANTANHEAACLELACTWAQLGNAARMRQYLEQYLLTKNKKQAWEIKCNPAFKAYENSTEWLEIWKKDWYSPAELELADAEYLQRSGNTTDALLALEKMSTTRSSFYEGQASWAASLIKQNEFEKALDIATKLTQRQGKNAIYFHLKSMAELGLGNASKAMKSLERAVDLDSNRIEFYFTKASIFEALEKFEEAEELSLWLSELVPGTDSYMLVAGIYTSAENHLQALRHYNKAIAQPQTPPQLYIARGRCYLATGTWNFAERDFSMAMDYFPKDGELYYLRAEARYGNSDTEAACSDWHKALERHYYKADKAIKQHCRKYLK